MKRTFLQKIARFILRDELRKNLKIRKEERRVLASFKFCYENKCRENYRLSDKIYELKRVKCFVPDFMFDAMIKSLPDPNKVEENKSIVNRIRKFVERMIRKVK